MGSSAQTTAIAIGNRCTANSWTSSTAAPVSTIAVRARPSRRGRLSLTPPVCLTSVQALQAALTVNTNISNCFPPAANGFYTISGVITATSVGKGLGVGSPALQQAWIADSGSNTVGTSLALFFSYSLTNAYNRGDSVTLKVYVSTSGGSLYGEVCAAPAATMTGTALTPSPVTTSLFTAPYWVYPGGGGNFTVGAPFPATQYASNPPPGGLCAASTKPLYDGALVTFTNAVVMSCANPVSNMYNPSSTNKVVAYPYCQPSLSPLSDILSGPAYNMTGVCTTCMWDKFSQLWISTDNGATGVVVSSQFFRIFNNFQLNVGSTMTLTGMLQYLAPQPGVLSSQWVLIPRNASDVVGLSAIPASTFPSVVIGDYTATGVKQQQYQWASPGPALPTYIDPNGITAAANLPLGVPATLVGPSDLVNSGSGNYYGTATWSGCPNASTFAAIYASSGPTQNLCDCYPPRYYSPKLGSNGAGTTYVTTTGIVSFIEGVFPAVSGVGSFYLQSGCGPNQQLFVYQDGAAGKTVTVGDNVTITATAYSYYGLVEMQNTLSVVVNSHGNTVCAPITLNSLGAFSNDLGACSASAVMYRANMVTIKNLVVSRMALYEPFPVVFGGGVRGVGGTTASYLGNGTVPGSAAFNGSTLCTNTIGSWGVAPCTHNWFNSNAAKSNTGTTPLHPLTGRSFSALIEVMDQYGNHILVDQCPYGANGGLVSAFMGTDVTPNTPLAIGDTFASITGVLKYSRGGTFQNGATGGNLMLCVTSDPTLAAGRVVGGATFPSAPPLPPPFAPNSPPPAPPPSPPPPPPPGPPSIVSAATAPAVRLVLSALMAMAALLC